MRTRASARLGADFTRLWTASAVSNVGDGVTVVAGPLLVASLTRDPVLVAGAAFVQSLSWLLFSLVGGVLADRLDRRRLIVVIDVVRAAALAGLCAAVATGTVGILLVYAVFFLLGACETIADTAAVARLPAIVAPGSLAAANARLMATFTVGNQFVAKPLGAWLFAGAAALPFGVDAVSFVAASVLVAGMRSVPAEPRSRGTLRGDIAEGVRWLWSRRLLRCLALSMGIANVAFCGAFAVFVLYARERLGLSGVGYGLLLTTFAVGGLTGTFVAGRLQRWFGTTSVLRAGLFVEALTHLTLAVTRKPWLAAAILVVFGVHTMVWGVIVTTLRQRAVPDRLLGRVAGVQTLLEAGGATLGLLLGGVLAQSLGVTAPYWIACAAMLSVAAAAWGPLGEASGRVVHGE
ncbi:MFS transporter [Actinoallomurus bryophytorum]|uniref:Na+/melibiose symporter-like transporter n=1 Tax=Actinoallomurus bryophytorum TaxID=1490222 RepID=A0A543CCF3_9ACTN|nr:MFS transporter [Actinoallomurus bryophytorum]TQL94782.1 Na+/melibiose symporter-like transporter [Actinoallomurus bryophytorum]